jgi:hypothetical protein
MELEFDNAISKWNSMNLILIKCVPNRKDNDSKGVIIRVTAPNRGHQDNQSKMESLTDQPSKDLNIEAGGHRS